MKYRILGKTGQRVSEIGFGAWAIGKSMWGKQNDQDSIKALHQALDLGVNFIDTALAYGDGHSEQIIGQVLSERKELDKIVIASKVPPLNHEWPGNPREPLAAVFPKAHIKRCVEKSLQNLRRDYIDLYQLHVWTDAWIGDTQWIEAMEELKQAGKVRFVGVSINDHTPDDALKLCASGKVDVLQVIYNIFDQSPSDRLFPEALRQKVGIIARVPFDEGSLTGKFTLNTTFSEGDFRRLYFAGERLRETVQRVEEIRTALGVSKNTDLAPYALRFCLDPEAVSTVIPGMRNPKQAEANCINPYQIDLSTDKIEALTCLRWERDYYS